MSRLFFSLILLLSCSPLFANLDLDTMQSTFILGTKQISVPGFPDAFNPSIVRWKNSLLMSFRTHDPKTGSTDHVGFIFLNADFDPISAPTLLKIDHPYHYSAMDNPRLIVVKGRLYMVYSNLLSPLKTDILRRIFIVELEQEGTEFVARMPEAFPQFYQNEVQRKEKNWVPFNYNNHLLLSYSIVPHRVVRPLFNQGRCEEFAFTRPLIDWSWGPIRGGTPAELIDGHYLAFFHSSKAMRSVQSNGVTMSHYFIGAYTFSEDPPFNVTGISQEPIVNADFYRAPDYPTWKPLRAVYPCGYVADADHLFVVYGRQDHECWVMTLDKEQLLNSLQPVSSITL